MRARSRLWLLSVVALVLASCDDDGSVPDVTAADTGSYDAASARAASDVGVDAHSADRDASAASDAKPREDARTPDDAASGSDSGSATARDAAGRSFSTDRGEFFGAPRCANDSFLLCEDFESEAVGAHADPAVWQTLDERISVDDTRAARGARALHVITHSDEGTHFIRTTDLTPATKLWGRLFFWVEPPRPTAFSHWTVIEGTGMHPAGGTARIRFGGIHVPNVENRLDFNYDIWGGRPANFHEVGHELMGHDTADSTWHCLEWLFDVSGREARLFRDGVEEAGLHAKDSIDGIALDFPTLDGLNIGMAIYQDIGSSSWNVWIDEVAFDAQRIGCSN